MLPATFPLDLYRGDTYRLTLRVWQDLAKTTPVNLAGALAAAEIRDQPGGAILASLACLITLPNLVAVVVTADLSRQLPAASSAWDCQLTLVGGDVKTIVAGPVTVTPDVTGSTSGLAGSTVAATGAIGGCHPTTVGPVPPPAPAGGF